jgi:hypothetical protein
MFDAATPLAHAGHWLGAVAAVIPVLLVVGWIAFTSLRDRRRRRAGR